MNSMIKKIDIRDLGERKYSDTQSQERDVQKGDWWTFLNKDIHIFGAGLPDKIKESFYLELSTLLGAGVDIRGALELIRNEQSKKVHRNIFEQILQQVIMGSTLSAVLKSMQLFTAYEYYSIQIGEETGKLTMVLAELAVYYKKKIEQRRQVIGALTYPMVIVIIATLAVSFMMTYVVPMFSDVLRRFGGDLPLITKLVLRASAIVREFSLFFFLTLAGTVVLLISQRKKLWYRRLSSLFLLRIPVIGEIIRKIYLSRFANTMSMLTASRIPMLQAIQLVQQMISFYPIETSLLDVSIDITAGIQLHKSLGKHSVYPKKMISLIKVGEEVNQLDIFFSKVSNQYSSEVEYQTSILSKFMEPLIIVVLGVVVGVILIAMYLPLFKLGQAV